MDRVGIDSLEDIRKYKELKEEYRYYLLCRIEELNKQIDILDGLLYPSGG